MKIKYPDYNNCITNLACSILKEFGVDTGNNTLARCDELLKKSYKNIVVILLDGMGKSIMDGNLEKDGFFTSHLMDTYSSVFPPTTVASTTSIDSGLQPTEHSWLGWDCYYKEIDKNVTVFRNTESGTDIPAADFWVSRRYCPYDSVIHKINRAGGHAYYATPFIEPYPATFAEICERIEKLCAIDEKKYIYAYWNEPDHTMHRKGCYGEEAKQVVRELEAQVEALCEKLENTLVLITADHGHVDSEGVAIEDYPKLTEYLVRMPSIEPRAVNLFIKEGFTKQFEEEFQKEFGDKFLLLTKEEVKRQELFGPGKEHPQFDGMLGDYLAAAVGDLSIYNTREEKELFIGVHAGLTEEEMIIPLIVVERNMMKETNRQIELPSCIREYIPEEDFQLDDVGMSASTIMLFEDKVLKIQDITEESETEYQVMEWLKGKLPVPQVLAHAKESGKDFLLMSKLSGEMSCDESYMEEPFLLTELLAEGLKMLWSVDVSDCPFCWNLDRKLAAAKYNVENGLVDVDNVEPETFGENGFRDPAHLLEWLIENRPEEELVLVHGDYCLPNVFAKDGKVSGFLDLGKTGVADKWQDIALCYRSLLHNYEGRYGGKAYEGFEPKMLFEKLDIEPDWEKIRYYILMDELF